MRSSSVWIGTILILAITTSGGVIYGRLSNRWGSSQDLVDAGLRLERIPAQVGSWKSEATNHLTDSAKSELACSGDIVRQYIDFQSGASINVMLVVGPAGTIAVHTPEVCFSSQNYRPLGNRKRVEIQDATGANHTLWAVDFELNDVEAMTVRVYYAWSLGGAWLAPDDPRLEFVGSPSLYKIQLMAPVVLAPGPTKDPMPPFLRAFLSEAGEELLSTAVSH